MVGYGVSAPSMQVAAECLSECIPWCRPAVSTPASAKPFEGMRQNESSVVSKAR